MVARREPPASLPLPAQGLPKHRSCLGWPEQRAADCPNLTMESREKEAPVRHQRSLWLPPPPFLRTPSRLPLFLTSVAPLAQRPHCTPGRRRGVGHRAEDSLAAVWECPLQRKVITCLSCSPASQACTILQNTHPHLRQPGSRRLPQGALPEAVPMVPHISGKPKQRRLQLAGGDFSPSCPTFPYTTLTAATTVTTRLPATSLTQQSSLFFSQTVQALVWLQATKQCSPPASFQKPGLWLRRSTRKKGPHCLPP